MSFLRLQWLFVSLALLPGAALADGGNHCEAIRENKKDCENVKGEKTQAVAEKCEKLLQAQKEAREAEKKSCEKEKVTTEQNAGCLYAASDQKGIDDCNAVGRKDLSDRAKEGAADQAAAKKKVQKAHDELDDAIQDAMDDPDLSSSDRAKLMAAEGVSEESDRIEKDISSLQAADESAGANALTGSDTSAARASALDSAFSDNSVAGAGQGASSSDIGAPSGAPLASTAAAAPDSSAVPDAGGGQTLSAPQAAAGLAGASPVTNAPLGNAAPVSAAPSPVQGSGIAAPAAGAALTPFVGTTPGGTSAAASLFGAEPTANGGGASQLGPRIDAAAPRMSDQMREDLRARIDRASKGRSFEEDGGVKLAGSLPRAEGWTGAGGGRAPASVEASGASEEETAPAPGSPQFSNGLAGQRFSLLGSDTDAAVKRLVGQLDAAKAVASAEGIGESNGPSLFARSHAILQSALRRGFVRGVAVR